MVRVLFADNHAIVRDGILGILADDPRIEVVGEAADFSEAITKARHTQPDVLIVDLHMPFIPDSSTRYLSAELRSCGARVLGISFANDDDARSLAASMGAAELLDKVELAKELIPAILRVASERNCSPAPVSAKASNGSEL